MTSPDDTWWMQVIQGMGGILGVNNSYAGSTVSGGFMTSGTSEKRLRTLSAEGEPDMIDHSLREVGPGKGVPIWKGLEIDFGDGISGKILL